MSYVSKLKKAVTGIVSTAVMAASIPAIGAGSGVSAASDNNYYEALALSLYFFDSNACGTGITGGPLTWRGDCHVYDAKASVGSLDGSLKSIVDPDGDGQIDVSGGWHDAGDHPKFNITIGFALSSLGLSEYFNEGIYEKAGCRDHLEYEMRWGADYLMKTTFLDSSGKVAAIAHTVADGNVDHSIWSSPEVQTYDRPVYWLTASNNNSAVCCEMAAGLAGTAYVMKNSDPAYAAKCIEYSKALLEFGQKNVGNNKNGIEGFYSTDSMYQDEEALTQAWLWILGEGSKPSRVPNNKDYGGVYDGWMYTWDKVWQGYSALMYKATGDQAFKNELIVEMNSQKGGLQEGTYNTTQNDWGASRYNCAVQMDAYTVADGDPNSSYAKAAKWQMDYILGNNNLGYSFLLGYGDKWPTHIHHRAANPGDENHKDSAANPSAKYTNYGMLVGGINNSGYEDHADRYQYTEGALDYNSCFAIACSYAANLYGGDVSTVKEIEKSASEINDGFKFGGSTPVVTTTTTTTTTTPVPTTTTTTATDISAITTQVTGLVFRADKEEIEVGETAHITSYHYTRTFYQNTGAIISEIETPYNIECNVYSDCVSSTGYKDGVTTIIGVKPGTFTLSDYYYTINITVKEKSTGSNTVWGDANGDGQVDMSDAVLVMQSLSNPDKYGINGSDPTHITEKGQLNADVYENGTSGITNEDALQIQKFKLELIPSLDPNDYIVIN